MPARLPLLLVAVVLVAAVVGGLLLGVGGDEPEVPETVVPPLRVAAGPDAESTLLAHVLVALLADGDIDAEVVAFGEARDTRQALERGDVELRPAYTGEAWLEVLGRADPPSDPRASFEEVRAHDAEEGLVWFRPPFLEGAGQPPANATFAFVVAGPPSIDADLTTVSQLASRLSTQPDATLCVDPEFASRPDGLRAVLAAYSVRSDQPVLAAGPAEAVRGVAAGDCIAGLTTATDGQAWAAGLRPLTDDLGVFPAFVVLPQVRRDTLLDRPPVTAAVRPLAAQLTTALLGGWNAEVHRGRPVEEVAATGATELRRRAGLPSVAPVP
jgi:osmoprotectant transport system substrate-binding protein